MGTGGRTAIAWELDKLGLDPPETATINRILRRAGVAKRRARRRYVPRGALSTGTAAGPSQRGPLDRSRGPHHLYALNAVDLGRRRAATEIPTSKEEWYVAEGPDPALARLAIPRRVELDNGEAIQGRGRQLAVPVWTCLRARPAGALHPVRRAQALPGCRALNDTCRQAFLSHRDVVDHADRKGRARAFERFHNFHHRYSVLKGATPDQMRHAASFEAWLPDHGLRLRPRCRAGVIDLVRLVRSTEELMILGSKLRMPRSSCIATYRRLHVRSSVFSWSARAIRGDELAFPLRW